MAYTREEYLLHREKQRALFAQYAKYISKKNCGIGFPPGWYDIVRGIFEFIESRGYEDVRVQQIKEKFGGLRFYYEGGDDELFKVVEESENRSYKTCDMCGKMGERYTTGRINTRCSEHRLDRWPELTSEDYDAIDAEDIKLQRKFSPEKE